MKTKLVRLLIAIAITTMALVSCLPSNNSTSVIPEVTQTQFLGLPEDFRNNRYCEIVPMFSNGLTITAKVYATMGLNSCPDDSWKALEQDELTKRYGALTVTMNGPRYTLMNKIIRHSNITSDTPADKVIDVDGIEMRQAAIFDLKLWDIPRNSRLYTEIPVQRDTSFIYYAGNRIYDLIAPDGTVYRMQSYSQIIDSDLKIEDLETLSYRLNLPKGWQYQTSVLTEDIALRAEGLAYVIQDEFRNSYQRMMQIHN